MFRKRKGVLAMKTYYESMLQKVLEKENYDTQDLPILYAAYCYNKTTNATIATYLEKTMASYHSKQVMKVEKIFRSSSTLYYCLDWSNYPLATLENMSTFTTIVTLGTFHPNGYFREHCLHHLPVSGHFLPYFLLRMLDWVPQIRKVAYQKTKEILPSIAFTEFLNALPYFQKIMRSQFHDYYHTLLSEITTSINKEELSIEDIISLDINAKKILYHSLSSYSFTKAQCLEIIDKEREAHCLLLLSRQLYENYDPTIKESTLLLHHRNYYIRKQSMQYLYLNKQDIYKELYTLLVDTNHGIRELAYYYINKHVTFDIVAFYKPLLDTKKVNIAIAGIGYYGNYTDYSLLLPFLESTSTIKCTIQALSRLLKEEGKEIYMSYLFHNNLGVTTACVIALIKHRIQLPIDTIMQYYYNSVLDHHKKAMLQLLLHADTWERLPYTLTMYDQACFGLQKQIQTSIENRNMYACVSNATAQKITHVLSEMVDILPTKIIKRIQFDLSFVTNKP